MSEHQQYDIECPECGKVTSLTIWTSINVQINPEMKKAIINQETNMLTCPVCAYQDSVDIPLLYHDMEKKFCIQYVSKNEMKSPDYYSNLKKDTSLRLESTNYPIASEHYLLNPHYVFSLREMAAYIIFRDLCEEYGQ